MDSVILILVELGALFNYLIGEEDSPQREHLGFACVFTVGPLLGRAVPPAALPEVAVAVSHQNRRQSWGCSPFPTPKVSIGQRCPFTLGIWDFSLATAVAPGLRGKSTGVVLVMLHRAEHQWLLVPAPGFLLVQPLCKAFTSTPSCWGHIRTSL